MWVQLALFEAARRALIVSHNLQTGIRHLAHIWRQAVHERSTTTTPDELDPVDEQPWPEEPQPDAHALDQANDMLESAFGCLREPTLLPPRLEPAENEPREHLEDFDHPELAEFFSAPRYRVYLLDEPEQHLHPALERRAASWLSTAMSQWAAQCVIATHAIAFIDIPGDRHVYELSRTEYAATIAPLDPKNPDPVHTDRAIDRSRPRRTPRPLPSLPVPRAHHRRAPRRALR